MRTVLRFVAAMLAATLLAQAPAWGDAARGKKNFKQCAACHTLKEGKNKVGPSLHQVFGRKAALAPKFKYSKGMKQAAEMGLVWTRQNLLEYLKDPRKFLRKYTKNKKAKNKMLQKFKKKKFREDVVDYLESLKASGRET